MDAGGVCYPSFMFSVCFNRLMEVELNTAQTVLQGGFKIKKRLHPVGRLGAHIKHGVGASFEAYLREESRMARLSQAEAARAK